MSNQHIDDQLLDALTVEDIALVNKTLKNGANPNHTYHDGSSLLLWAITNREAYFCEVLIKAGADINHSHNNVSIISRAAELSRSKLKLVVEHGANINSKDAYGNTPLIRASQHLHIRNMQYLIGNGADVNARNTDSRTALISVLNNASLKQNDRDKSLVEYATEMLLKAGANPNVIINKELKPLVMASMKDLDLLKMLFDYGADPSNDFKELLMECAKSAVRGALDLVLDRAPDRLKIHDLLGEALIKSINYSKLDNVRTLLARGASANFINKAKEVPITIAAAKDYLPVIKLLIKHGADCSEKNRCGSSALDILKHNNNPMNVPYRKEAISLIEHQLLIQASNKSGLTDNQTSMAPTKKIRI